MKEGATLAMLTRPDKVLGWLSGAHREWVGSMKATGFGLESTEVLGTVPRLH